MAGYRWEYSGGPMVGVVDARPCLWRRTIAAFWGETLTGFHPAVSYYDFAVGYHLVRA